MTATPKPPGGDPKDRLLEQALHTVLEPEQRRVERARAIARAFLNEEVEPGVARPEVEEAIGGAPHGNGSIGSIESRGSHRSSESEGEQNAPRTSPDLRPRTAERPIPRQPRRLARRPALALAAVVVAAISLWWLFARQSSDVSTAEKRVIASSGTPVEIVPASSALAGAPGALPGEARRDTEVHLGEAVRTLDEAGRLEHARGRLELAPWSVAAFPAATDVGATAAVTASLLYGELRIAADQDCTVRVGEVTLNVRADSTLIVTLRDERQPAVEPAAHPADAWSRSGAPQRLLRYALVRGGADASGADWSLALDAGDVGSLPDGERPPVPLTPEEEDELLAALEELWIQKPGQEYADVGAVRAFYAGLAERPASWDSLLAFAREDVHDKRIPDRMKRGWIDLLCMGDDPRVDQLARALWLEVPHLFEPWHIVWLAERGAFEFQREMRAMLNGPLDQVALLPALALAVRGDEDALEVLHRFSTLESTPPEVDPTDGWAPAWALAIVGDRGAWDAKLRALEGDVHAALELLATDTAARLVLTAEFFRDEMRGFGQGDPAALATIAFRHARHVAERSQTVRSSGEILAVLAEVGQ